MNRKEISIAVIMMFGVAVFHFFIPRDFLSLHIFFRLLYLVPIAYIALYSGRKGGMLAAITMTIIFLPHFFMDRTTQDFTAGNIAVVILFYITGFFVGSFRDSSERGVIKQQLREVAVPFTGEECNILFFIDDSPLSAASAKWFGAYFGGRDIVVTLLWVNEDESEKFASQELADESVSKQGNETAAFMDEVRDMLIGSGIPQERVLIKNVAVTGKVPISDKILEELKDGDYDLLLLAKHQQTKAQEFLFGDVPIRLLREASIPVLSVKGTPEESSSPSQTI